jgi:phosphoribosylamine--glycine ligase
VILASQGYPGKPRIGEVINGLEATSALEGVNIFHSGTAFNANKQYVTAGGRVLGVTAVGNDLAAALGKAYSAVGHISWPGMQYRHDIGK